MCTYYHRWEWSNLTKNGTIQSRFDIIPHIRPTGQRSDNLDVDFQSRPLTRPRAEPLRSQWGPRCVRHTKERDLPTRALPAPGCGHVCGRFVILLRLDRGAGVYLCWKVRGLCLVYFATDMSSREKWVGRKNRKCATLGGGNGWNGHAQRGQREDIVSQRGRTIKQPRPLKIFNVTHSDDRKQTSALVV